MRRNLHVQLLLLGGCPFLGSVIPNFAKHRTNLKVGPIIIAKIDGLPR